MAVISMACAMPRVSGGCLCIHAETMRDAGHHEGDRDM